MSKPKKLQIRNSTAEFLVFTSQAGEKGIEVRVEDETVWLTQKLIGVLFDVDVRTVSEHLQNIFSSGELSEDAVIRKFRNTASDGKSYLTAFYNLDAFLQFNQRDLLDHPGKVTAEIAKAFAESEFEKYRVVQDRLFESDFDRMIKQLPKEGGQP
jgi:hypothetical protein